MADAREVVVQRVTNPNDDVLIIEGTVDGEPTTAQGWLSAMTNHYDASAYGDDGHRDPKAQPRAMDDDERMAYWHDLLLASVPAPADDAPAVLFEAPDLNTGGD